MNQMNHNNIPNTMQNNINQNQAQNQPNEEDINFVSMYGIKDPKKKIIFKNSSTKNIYKAKISKYFTKNELYWLIGHYEKSNFILIYKDDILENDESNIDDIPDGTTIEIYTKIKEGSLIKNPYYSYLLEKNKDCLPILIKFSFYKDRKLKNFNVSFPCDISVSQMIKVLKFEFKDHFHFIFEAKKLEDNDDSKLSRKFGKDQLIYIIDYSNMGCGFKDFKEFKAIILVKDKNIVKTTKVCRFYSIDGLISNIENILNSKIKTLFIEDKKIDLNNEETIASLGIKDDFICTVEI
jgi:hypothetical protein